MTTTPMRQAAATRVPPHDLDAEESLLGAMLLSRDAIVEAVQALPTSHRCRLHDLTVIA